MRSNPSRTWPAGSVLGQVSADKPWAQAYCGCWVGCKHTVWYTCSSSGTCSHHLVLLAEQHSHVAVSASNRPCCVVGSYSCPLLRLVKALASALACPATQPFALLWLSLVQQAVSLSPSHAGTAALVLPLRTCVANVSASAAGGAGGSSRCSEGGCTELLQQTWRQIGCWMAAAETRGGCWLIEGSAIAYYTPTADVIESCVL